MTVWGKIHGLPTAVNGTVATMKKQLSKMSNNINGICCASAESGNIGFTKVFSAGHKPPDLRDGYAATVVHYANATNAKKIRSKISKIGVWNMRTHYQAGK